MSCPNVNFLKACTYIHKTSIITEKISNYLIIHDKVILNPVFLV